MITQEQIQSFLEENPELAEAMKLFKMSTETYSQALKAINPVVRYTSTSTRDAGPGTEA